MECGRGALPSPASPPSAYEGVEGIEFGKAPQRPEGEDIAVGLVVNGAGFVEHPSNILLQAAPHYNLDNRVYINTDNTGNN